MIVINQLVNRPGKFFKLKKAKLIDTFLAFKNAVHIMLARVDNHRDTDSDINKHRWDFINSYWMGEKNMETHPLIKTRIG